MEFLAKLWSANPRPPSIGVVTFNRDQADLIEQRLEELAEEDPAFQSAYRRELSRFEQGEDMRFFVKNVENVQGDERDHIIFSTTFGVNPEGAFERFYKSGSLLFAPCINLEKITGYRVKLTALPLNILKAGVCPVRAIVTEE